MVVEVAGSNCHSHTVDNLNGNSVQLALPYLEMDPHMVLQVELSYHSSPVQNMPLSDYSTIHDTILFHTSHE